MDKGINWRARLGVMALAALTALAALAGLPASSLASGGATIASAPTVVYGQQEFGNTATDNPGKKIGCNSGESWWSLQVLAGDHITIDYEGAVGGESVFPVGTTDFNVSSTQPLGRSEPASNGKQETSFNAPVNGSMPLQFISYGQLCEGSSPSGPYSFTATDQHTIAVSLRRYLHVKPTTTLIGTASLADGTPVPDGTAFTLTAAWSGHHSVSYTATSSGGQLAFRLRLPASARGRLASFVITRPADSSYLAAASAKLVVKVAPLRRRWRRGGR